MPPTLLRAFTVLTEMVDNLHLRNFTPAPTEFAGRPQELHTMFIVFTRECVKMANIRNCRKGIAMLVTNIELKNPSRTTRFTLRVKVILLRNQHRG